MNLYLHLKKRKDEITLKCDDKSSYELFIVQKT